MLQFVIQFTVCWIVISQVVKCASTHLSEEFKLNSTEMPTSDTLFSNNENFSEFLDIDDKSSDLVTSIDDEGYEEDDLTTLSDDNDSDFTIVYDKRNGYKTIPLSEIPQADEIISAFDAARDVQFELYTPKNPNQPQLLTLDNYTTVEQSHFNWLYNTRMLIHGW